MSAPAAISLVLRATPEEVMVAVEALERHCRAHGVAEEATYALMLALEETGANVVNHAYARDPARTFRVTVERREGGVAVEVRDDGPPFDPLAPRPSPAGADPDDPPVGGLGIALIRRSADRVAYAREGGENVLRLWKRVD